MVDAGLPALEAFHSDHDASTTEHYLALAERHGILVSGGSDYHGDKERRRAAFGTVGLPPEHFERLDDGAAREELRWRRRFLRRSSLPSPASAAAIYLGLSASSTAALAQHISIGIFSTMITLLAHSMMMFYFLGKGKAVTEAAAEGGLSKRVRAADCGAA